MPESNISECGRIGTGDLVTYRSIKDFTKENYQQKFIIHGIGIVVAVDDEYAKVYWLHAQQFLWVTIVKLTTFASSSA